VRVFIFNAISFIFFVLTIVVAAGVIYLMVQPLPEPDISLLPTVAPDLPTLTPTFTHTPTIPPTFTPTHTPTPTVTSTSTSTPTVTASPTVTNTFTPTETLGPPTETLPPTITPTPTGPTPIPSPTENPYPFSVRGEVRYTTNFANTLGCAWQGIGGQVFDLNGIEFNANFQVRVFNNTMDQVIPVGSNSFYGPISGWEVQVANTVNNDVYFVQLETVQGTDIAPRIQVQFTSDCSRNVALVDFQQTRSFGPPPVPSS
jgi:hypothetical protein